MSLKPICYLIKCIVVAAPINSASSWTFCFSALPASTSARTTCVIDSQRYGIYFRVCLRNWVRHHLVGLLAVYERYYEKKKTHSPVVALIDNLRPGGVDVAIVLTRTFTFPHTGTQAVVEEASWTLAARLAVGGVLRDRQECNTRCNNDKQTKDWLVRAPSILQSHPECK